MLSYDQRQRCCLQQCRAVSSGPHALLRIRKSAAPTFLPSMSVTLCAFMRDACAMSRSASSSVGDSAFSFSRNMVSCSGVITFPLRRLPLSDTAAKGGALQQPQHVTHHGLFRGTCSDGVQGGTKRTDLLAPYAHACCGNPRKRCECASSPPCQKLCTQRLRMLTAVHGDAAHAPLDRVCGTALEVREGRAGVVPRALERPGSLIPGVGAGIVHGGAKSDKWEYRHYLNRMAGAAHTFARSRGK